MPRLEGVYPAILTPFDENGQFNDKAYEKFIDHLYGKGVHGLYVCGVSGEGLMMRPEERERVAEVAVKSSQGRGHVIVHVGCGNTTDSVRLARHASRIGASAVGCLAPYTNQYGLEALRAHFMAVRDAAQPLPFLLYYTPQIAASLNSYRMLECLLDLPGIAGVKFTGTDAGELAVAIFERKKRQTVLSGVDEMFVATLLMGAHGAIASFINVVPELFVDIYNLARNGRWNEASEQQRRLVEIIRITERYPFLSALKAIVRWQAFELGEPRPPQPTLTSNQRSELHHALEAAGMKF